MFGINRDITLAELFDKSKYYCEVKPIERIINGETVMRKRHIFFPIREPEIEEDVSGGSEKKVKKEKVKLEDTFIPLFADLFGSK